MIRPWKIIEIRTDDAGNKWCDYEVTKSGNNEAGRYSSVKLKSSFTLKENEDAQEALDALYINSEWM